jgi:hypothetical protein
MLQEPTAPSGLFTDALHSAAAEMASAHAATTKVLLLGDPQPHFKSAESVLTSFRGVSIAAAYRTATQLKEWLQRDGAEWQLAFIDFACRTTIAPQFVQALLADQQSLPGEIVVFGEPEWPAMLHACKSIGVHHVLKRGDMAALQSFMESRGAVRQLS